MIYLFDKDEKLFKIVNKPAIKTALQKYTLTTERYVSDRLTAEMKALNDDELEKVEYMAIQTMEDAHTFHYFYVAQKSSENLTTLIGVQSGIEELRKSPVFDKRPQNAFAREVIDDLLEGTNWRARFVGETTPHSTNFYYISTFDALKKVCEVWDLEMQFFVEMNGNRIGARYIDFKRKIGASVGKRVVYGHNALQILQEVERTNLYTALIGRGKGEQVSTAEGGENANGQVANGYGRKITFEDVVWRRADGKPVDKPAGQKYVELPEMTARHGTRQSDGSMRAKIGFVEFSDEEDREVLLQKTYEALVETSRPQVTFKTSAIYLKGVAIGDTIRVVRHDKKLDYDTRVFEITFNRLNDESSDIKLGDRIGESKEATAKAIADKAIDEFVANEFNDFILKLPDFLPSADGFNTNWYGAEDPTVSNPGKVLINDIWYKPDPEHEGHTIMLRWTGEIWEEILRTADNEVVKRSFEARMKDIEALKKEQADLSKRNEKELEAFRKELQGFSFDDETIDRVLAKVVDGRFDQVKETIRAVSETSRVNAEMIGNDGTTRYNKNLLKGGTLREVALDGVPAQVEAQGGFKAGVTYTISFESLCELLQQLSVSFEQTHQKPWSIVLEPTNPRFSTETTTDTTVKVYPDDYRITIRSDWYETKVIETRLSEANSLIRPEMVYRSVADGNQDETMLGVWAERPDIIFDGGGN